MRRGSRVFFVATVVVALAAVPVAIATEQDNQRSALKERINVKKQMGGAMAAIAKVAKGEVEFGPDVVKAAEKFAALSPHIERMFPKGSAVGDSRAKAEIWVKWEDFEKKAANLESSAAELLPAVRTGETAKIRSALTEVGKACTSCHDQYREPKS